MTDESDLRDFERRIRLTLHAAAPRPAPDLADRLLRRTALVQQRRGLFGLSFAPALTAAAVVVAAVAVGIGLGNMLPRGSNVGGPSEPTVTSAPPSPTLEAPPSPSDGASTQPFGVRRALPGRRGELRERIDWLCRRLPGRLVVERANRLRRSRANTHRGLPVLRRRAGRARPERRPATGNRGQRRAGRAAARRPRAADRGPELA
jgi:hypothetical protein